jgi:hypothetical protein
MPAKPKGKGKEKQDPEQQPAASASSETVKGLLGGFNGVETFKAKATGTVYGIIAEAKGLTLAIAPKITPAMGLIGIFVRVRVQKKEEWANLADGPALFGFPVNPKSHDHSSCEAFVAVSLQPCTPYQVGKVIEEKAILESLVAELQKRVESAGQKLVISPDAVVMYLKNVFDTVLPTEEQKQIDEFPVCVGDEEIAAHAKALYEKFGKKKAPKPAEGPEHPPGMHGQNPD